MSARGDSDRSVTSASTLLAVEDLEVAYRVERKATRRVLRGVSLDVKEGELVAIVGESGSGKTTLIRAALGILARNGEILNGRIVFGDTDVTRWRDRQFAKIRGPYVGFVPQDPGNSLNPVKRVGRQVAEAVLLHDRRLKGRAANERAVEKLRTAGLKDAERVFAQFPHELSGGMKQRVLIAIALASDPKLLIADEPTSALDVTVQKTILDHLDRLRAELDLGVLLITHDLGVAAERSDRLIVMQRGAVVEVGPTAEVTRSPRQAYTKRLIDAAPASHSGRLSASPQAAALAIGWVAAEESEVGPDVMQRPLLTVTGLEKHFTIGHGRGAGRLTAVDSVSFSIARGTTHAIVGESGAGKSTVARIAVGFTKPDGGMIEFSGVDLAKLSRADRRSSRRDIQFVYQNPFASLDPRFTVRRVIAEPLQIHGVTQNRAAIDGHVSQLLEAVALDESYLSRRPAELSGGEAQRVAIARAIALRPKLVILDEAVSALDVSVQAQVLQLLADLQAELGLTYLFITHDLGVVRLIADTVSVMLQGRVVEQGPVEQILADPRETYTQDLIAAIPGRQAVLSA
jgi:peptide/nickel transport system ATP-binding protein